MEMYKIVRLSVFAWISILLLMLILDTIGLNIFFPSKYAHVYAKSIGGAAATTTNTSSMPFGPRVTTVGPEMITYGDISEEYEEEDEENELGQARQQQQLQRDLKKKKQEEEDDDDDDDGEDICRAVMCPRTEYCYVLRPGVAQCRRKTKPSDAEREVEEGGDTEDESDESDSSEEDSGEAPKERRTDKTTVASTTKKPTSWWGPFQSFNKSHIVQCPACPIGRGHLLCGSDNITYSSMCRLEFHNCIHGSAVKFSCFGYCPCMKVYEKVMLPPPATAASGRVHKQQQQQQQPPQRKQDKGKSSKQMKMEYYNKLEQTNIRLQPDKHKDRQYNQALAKEELAKLYYHVDGVNEVAPKKGKVQAVGPKKIKMKSSAKNTTTTSKSAAVVEQPCGHEQLRSMGLRLLDWFAVVMAEEMKLAKKAAAAAGTKKNNNTTTTGYKKRGNALSNLSPDKLLPECERAVSFMFHHFDVDTDYRLSFKELYYLEHDEGERCLEPYLLGCDEDANGYLTAYEWCSCFNLRMQPCAYNLKHPTTPAGLVGTFRPKCTASGQYRPVQCHASLGQCWCVDRDGNEIAGTKVRGRYPTCDKTDSSLRETLREIEQSMAPKSTSRPRSHPIEEFEDDEDLELDDSLEQGHGSGHHAETRF